jgi:hypothetical protein
VADLWNDAGAGPWSQDDANPDMLGFMLRGYAIPTAPKRLLPTGAFAKFTEGGDFEATWAPVVDNPFFAPGGHDMRVINKGEALPAVEYKTIDLDLTGQKTAPPVVAQRVTTAGLNGAALDIRMTRGAYRVDVSPDGEHWMPRLDTWCDAPVTRSVDLSFLVGGRDELVRALEIALPDDAAWLQSSRGTEIARERSRAIAPDGAAVYRVALPHTDQCRLEFLVGNNYRIDLSATGSDWTEALSPKQIVPAKGDAQQNAGWLRMVDASKYVGSGGQVFIRIRNAGNDEAYGGAAAFVRRIAVFASYKSPEIHLRITGAPYAKAPGFVAEWVRLRTW